MIQGSIDALQGATVAWSGSKRYHLIPDVLTEREVTKLRFVRWLVQTGRLQVG